MRAQGPGLPVELHIGKVHVGRQKLIALLMGLIFRLQLFRTLASEGFVSIWPMLSARGEEYQVSGNFSCNG